MDLLAGIAGPCVPYLPERDAADRGPAGSLVQARDRQRLLRRSERRAARADWRTRAAGGLAALACRCSPAAGQWCSASWPAPRRSPWSPAAINRAPSRWS
jgi:hypothetical protein